MEKSPTNITVLLPLERLLSIAQSSGTLDNLASEGQVHLILPSPIVPASNFPFHHYLESRVGRIFREIVLNVDTMLKSAEIKSFETRVRIVLGLNLSDSGKYRLGLGQICLSVKKPRTFLSYFAYLFSALKCFHAALRGLTLLWPSLAKALFRSRPDVVLIFSGGAFSGVENVCLFLCKVRKIPTVLIVDNWDNLSSKSIFWVSPTSLGVWGNNMRNDALEIHQMRPEIIRHIGSARFRPHEHEVVPLSTEFILFAGSGKPLIDELDAVLKVREYMDTLGLSSFKLIYRPHPISGVDMGAVNRICGDRTRIHLDPSFGDNLQGNFYTKGPLSYLESLCKFARIVIAPQSSIIVESLSLGTPVISLNWSDTSPGFRPLEQYTHFNELTETKGFFVAHDFEALRKFIAEAIVSKFDRNLVPEILPTFYDLYQDRVLALVNQTLIGSKERA